MKSIICLTLAACFLAPVVVKAETVKIVNENKKALSVKICAEGSSMTEKLAQKRVDIPAEEFYEFNVSSEDLNGKSLYFIEGDTNPFTPGGSCKNMHVSKKYRVTFKNDTLGTSCVSTELDS
ncbi:MAG: hypothetical protein ACK5TR_05535 [Alphaproteobacteria bacterium]|jgi:putative SOS response-associated peptidase YedK